MKHPIWHILKKDFRRTWLAVAALAIVLCGKALLISTLLYPPSILRPSPPYVLNYTEAESPQILNAIGVGDFAGLEQPKFPTWLEPALGLFLYADFLLLLLLVVWVVTEDTPLGDKAFWRARPVSSLQMFAAKAVFIGLVAWPMQALLQITTAEHAGYGFYGDSLHYGWAGSVVDLSLIQAVLVASFVIAAVLWRNILLGLCMLLALFFLICVAPEFSQLYAPHPETFRPVPSILLWMLLALLVAGWMYIGRNRWVGFLLLFAGFSFLLYISWGHLFL